MCLYSPQSSNALDKSNIIWLERNVHHLGYWKSYQQNTIYPHIRQACPCRKYVLKLSTIPLLQMPRCYWKPLIVSGKINRGKKIRSSSSLIYTNWIVVLSSNLRECVRLEISANYIWQAWSWSSSFLSWHIWICLLPTLLGHSSFTQNKDTRKKYLFSSMYTKCIHHFHQRQWMDMKNSHHLDALLGRSVSTQYTGAFLLIPSFTGLKVRWVILPSSLCWPDYTTKPMYHFPSE